MKKFYFLFIVLMLLLCNNSYAIIMPVDSLHVAISTTTSQSVQAKQAKLPFFKRLTYNILLKKLNKQVEEKKPLNKVGLAAFLLIAVSAILLLILPFTARMALLSLMLIGFFLNLLGFVTNKDKRNPFGVAGLVLILLLALGGLFYLITVGA